jgi:hypothetical protein
MKSKISPFNRIFKRNSPARILNAFFLARFLDGRGCIPGTLISAIVKANISPCIVLLFTTQPRSFGPAGGVSATADEAAEIQHCRVGRASVGQTFEQTVIQHCLLYMYDYLCILIELCNILFYEL